MNNRKAFARMVCWENFELMRRTLEMLQPLYSEAKELVIAFHPFKWIKFEKKIEILGQRFDIYRREWERWSKYGEEKPIVEEELETTYLKREIEKLKRHNKILVKRDHRRAKKLIQIQQWREDFIKACEGVIKELDVRKSGEYEENTRMSMALKELYQILTETKKGEDFRPTKIIGIDIEMLAKLNLPLPNEELGKLVRKCVLVNMENFTDKQKEKQ